MYSREPAMMVERGRSCIRVTTTKISPIRTAAADPASR